MKSILFLSLITAGVLGSAWAGGSAEDSYREACRVLSEARKAWQEKESDLAWQRYLEAKKLFVAIQRDYPQWNAETVSAHLAVCTAGSEKTAPRTIRELDKSIRDLKRFSADLDKLKTQKLVALQQADWEYNFVYDRITRLMDNYVARRDVMEEATESPGGPAAEGGGLVSVLEEAGLAGGGGAVDPDAASEQLTDEMEVEIGTTPGESYADSDETYGDIYDRVAQLIGDYVSEWLVGEDLVSIGPDAEEDDLVSMLSDLGLAEGGVTVGMDSDNDELNDEVEVEIGTSPSDPDTDNDGFYDGDEVEAGYDPLDDSSHPDVDDVTDYDEDNIDWGEQEGYTDDGEPDYENNPQ